MTHLLARLDGISAAAGELVGIRSAVSAAGADAADATTGVVAAAKDEVSALTTAVFNSFGQDYQALLTRAVAFHDGFVRSLGGAESGYAQAEAAADAALRTLVAPARASIGPVAIGGPAADTLNAAATSAATRAVDAVLIMGGSGEPTPTVGYLRSVFDIYLHDLTSATGLTPVSTAEGLFPYTGLRDLTLDVSVARGVTELNNAISQAISPGTGGSIAVLGYSQSSVIASLEMPKLLAQGYNPSQVLFTLIGDPSNPNGGLLTRFPGFHSPSLGVTFGVVTPSDAFPTTIWTLEYDGFADFPQYPIDLLADLNAFAGIAIVHPAYPSLTAAQLGSAVTLGQSGAPTMTTYNLIPTHDLPLLQPLRNIPVVGKPLADLLQPDLTYLVNWGYGDPAYGYSTGPADVPTPFGFLPPLSATTSLGPDLVSGTQQGIGAFAKDLAAQGLPSPPSIGQALAATPTLSAVPALPGPPTVTGILSGIEASNNTVVDGVTNAFVNAYTTLLPTADIATALTVTLPSYDLDLFLDGITQAVNGQPLQGLVSAIGDPIAANVGLITLAGGFEYISLLLPLDTILTGTPFPAP